VNGTPRAYRVSALCDPRASVINDVIAGVPVSITYNHLQSRVRIFTTSEKSDTPLDIGIRGWKDGVLFIAVDGKVVAQDSDEISSESMEAGLRTWKDWKAAHPASEIYSGHAPDALGAD